MPPLGGEVMGTPSEQLGDEYMLEGGGDPPLSRHLLVRTAFGWGKVKRVRGEAANATLEVKLDWPGILYCSASEVRQRSRAPLGACVLTTMGPGVLVEFRRRDAAHVVRLWNRIGCDGTALAYLQPEAVLRIIRGSPGMEVVTPKGSGQLLAYLPSSPFRESSAYLVKLADAPPSAFPASQIDCPRARVQPLLESLMGKLQGLWRGQLMLGPTGRFRLTMSESRTKLCLGIEGDDGSVKVQTEVSVCPKELSSMLEGQGVKAVDGVRGWLKEEKASDWLEGGRSRLYGLLNGDGQVEEKKQEVNFWDLPSLLGASSAFNLHGAADIKEAWEAARLGEIMTLRGPWRQLARIVEDDDRLEDVISEVKREWRVLERMRDKFRHTKAITCLLQGMGDLISRFQKLSEAPEFSFLQKRGIFFMNQFLHPSAPSVTKAKQLVDAAQSRMERRLEGEESQPLASLTQALGLGILVDLEALLRSNLTQLQAFISAFHSLRQQGFTVEGLNRMEGALLLLFDLTEHSSLKPPPTITSPRAAHQEVTQMLSELGAPSAVREVAKRLSEGRYSLQEAAHMLLELLETSDMVSVSSELIKHGEALLNRLEEFRASPAFRAFLTNLSDSSLEERLFANLESLNPEELLDGAEAALTDGTARQRLLSHVTDLCLDFLLDYLPSMPIPAITGVKDNVEYTISHLDMSGFKLKKEDVEVVLAQSNGEQGGGSEEVLVVNVQHISAQFKALKWSYKQNYFPNMKGDGVADANVVDGCIRLGFRVKRREVPASGGQPATVEPVVCVSSRRVSIARLDLRVDQCAMAWLLNLLASLFSEGIRDYIIKTLHETLADNMADLLGVLNDYARSAWPVLSRLTGLELSSLPLFTEEDELEMQTDAAKRDARSGKKPAADLELDKAPALPAPGPLDIEVAIRSQRHLGIHVDVNETDNTITIRGITPDGDFAKSVPPALRPARLVGATWTGINGRSIFRFPVTRVIPTIRKLPRPLTLHLRLAAPPANAPLPSPSGGGSGPAVLQTSSLTFHQPACGIRFKPSATLPSTVVVSGFMRGEQDAMLPAEASGVVKLGQVLVAVNGVAVRGLPIQDLTARLKDPRRPMTLTLADSPDIEYRFEQGEVMDLSVAAFDRDVVVTGFVPCKGPVETSGRCQPGDTLLRINGVDLPTANGYMADMDLLRHCTYPCHLVFARQAGQEGQQVVELVLPEKKGRWGVLFVRGPDDRPVIRQWNGLPGPAQASGRVRPGMTVLKVGEAWLADMVAEGVGVEAVADRVRGLRPPVTLTLRAMDLFSQWAAYQP